MAARAVSGPVSLTLVEVAVARRWFPAKTPMVKRGSLLWPLSEGGLVAGRHACLAHDVLLEQAFGGVVAEGGVDFGDDGESLAVDVSGCTAASLAFTGNIPPGLPEYAAT